MDIEVFVKEVRLAFRSLRRRPATSFVVVATLALGLGANTAVFSVLRSVLLAPLPYAHAERLVRIYGTRTDRPDQYLRNFLPKPATEELRDEVGSLDGVAVVENYSAEWIDVTDGSAPERVRILRVNAEYFDVLGAPPVLGRSFTRAEESADSRAAIVSEDIWARYLGGSRDAVGRSLTLDGVAYTVVGVVADGFADPLSGQIKIWLPADLSGATSGDWDNNYLSAVARLAPDADVASLRSELDVVVARHDAINADAAEKGYAVVPLRDDVVGSAGPMLNAVMGAVLFLLLLTCVNVASVMVATAAGRQRELAVRTSVGSPRSSLVRLFLIEAAILAGAGAILGLGLGSFALEGLLSIAPAGLPRVEEVDYGVSALVFGAGAAVVIGVALGLATAIPFSRPRVHSVLGGARGGGGSPASRRVRSALVIAEVALAAVLLIGAGVLVRTVQELRARDLGADPEGVLTFQVGLPEARYPTDESAVAFREELHRRIASLPGVTSAASTTRLPVTGTFNTWGTKPAIAVGEPVDMENIQVNQRFVLGDFFRTADLSLLSGREFGPEDDFGVPYVTVVNQTLVRLLFPRENPVGRLLRISGRYARIVGVVEDEALTARDEPAPMAYHSLRQWPERGGQLAEMVRVDGDVEALVPAIRSELGALDADLILFRPQPMADVVGGSIAQERFAAMLLSTFGVLAIVVAGLGLYGILSQLVGAQRHEIGVRMALGATSPGVRGMVVWRGVRLTLLGAGIGGIAAAGITKTIQFLLYGVGAHDPTVFSAVPIILLVIALASSYVPAARATRVDPVECFRSD